ncbi:MAG: lipid-transfer protein [Deltaproteobacteria bacterium]|nr:lipid-transfer protein [Deltaproteobacteria bacterium]MBW2419745.1 lipid-transfer protein [Deltaproteobacteria bacterium]
MASSFAGKTAIAGIGATEFSKRSGRSTLRLAVECSEAAIEDAGLRPQDIDGIVTYTVEENPEIDVARSLGIPELTHFSRIHHSGGAACGTIHQAAMAVDGRACKHVLVYRAFNERSETRFGVGVQGRAPTPTPIDVDFGWSSPFGLLTPASWVAMFATRYMHEYGATSEDFGRISVADRKHAATNPKAFFYGKPITLEEHQRSRWIVKPLHLLDCCQESDGGQAFVVTTLERARDLAHPPAVIASAVQGIAEDQGMMKSYYRDSITGIPEMGLCARQIWEDTGLRPADVQTAILYDHFTPLALPQLEEFGFCGRGEAKDFIRDGCIEMGGKLPINPNGGQLGEAYIHGMNGIAEGVRQVRGSAVNQVPDVENALVTAGTAVPTSAMMLSRDR